MAGAVQYITDGYKYLFEDLVHPVSKNWFLVGNPFPVIIILAIYLLFCLRIGPRFMKNRAPYEINNVIQVYNFAQILITVYMFIRGTFHMFSGKYNFVCQPLEDPASPEAKNEIVPLAYMYFILKIIDLLDTVFFVLRKSDRQITNLHLHHHTLMPIATWVAITYIPGGQGLIIGYLNTFVHIVMYTYYFISSLGDEYKKYVWWKKHLTTLQLVQFAIIAVQSINSLFHECGYPQILKILIIIYAFTFLNMFGQFYYNSYVKSNKVTIEQNGKSKINKAKSH